MMMTLIKTMSKTSNKEEVVEFRQEAAEVANKIEAVDKAKVKNCST